jgi:hypothetical protein
VERFQPSTPRAASLHFRINIPSGMLNNTESCLTS